MKDFKVTFTTSFQMLFYLKFLILRLPEKFLINSNTISEFDFTNSSFTSPFFPACRAKLIQRRLELSQENCVFKLNVLSTFLNGCKLPNSRLTQHSHLLSRHLRTPTGVWENSGLFRIFLRFGACYLLFITLRFSKPSTLFGFKDSTDLSIIW